MRTYTEEDVLLITLKFKCPFCGENSFIDVPAEDFEKYFSGELVQNCFPYLDASERELIISGICFECQKDIFKEV